MTGLYVVNAQMPWRGDAPGQRQGLLVKNDTTAIAVGEGIATSRGGFISYPTTTIFLAAGDRISLKALQTTGAAVDVPAAVLWILLQRKDSLAV